MEPPDWRLTVLSSQTDKNGNPRLSRVYAIDPTFTDQMLLEQVLPVFAPLAADFEARAASERDLSVPWKRMLQSLRDNKPHTYMAPDWQKHSATLIFWGGLGVSAQSAQLRQSSAVSNQPAAKRGRDQASRQGKVSKQGQQDANLLSTQTGCTA